MTPRPPSRRARYLRHGVVALSVIVTGYLSGVRPHLLFDKDGVRNALALVRGFAHPDLGGAFLVRIARLSLETLLIAVLATTLAMLIGVVLALASCKIPELAESPEHAPYRRIAGAAARFVVRGLLALFRSVPEIVWAFLFVRMIGLGPGPAVLGIAISSGGIFGKLFAELAEAVDPDSILALRRLGVGRFGILIYGVLPQVWRQWVAYSFVRLECSIRSAAILGIVGAGGLGSEIALSVRYFEYGKLATALLAILAFVVAFELASTVLRRRSYRWTVGLALATSVLAIIRLDIPWSDLTSSELFPSWLFRPGGSPLGQFVLHAIRLALETVAMAWCATCAAAVIALGLSLLTTNPLALRGRRRDAVRGRFGAATVASRLGSGLARLILQVCRSAPELALALLFVIWVGPGPFAGVLAIGVHSIGVLGRLYTDVYDEIEPGAAAALEAIGVSRFGVWLYAVLPQATPRLIAFTLYRFEVNVRATAMVGFVGAGGIGDSIDTAIALFHGRDLLVLVLVLIGVVVILDLVGDRVRHRLLSRRAKTIVVETSAHGASLVVAAMRRKRRSPRRPRAIGVAFRVQGGDRFERGTIRTLSAYGMFVETKLPCPAGSVVELELASRLPTAGEDRPASEGPTRVMGRVVDVRDGEVPGMAIELLEPLGPASPPSEE